MFRQEAADFTLPSVCIIRSLTLNSGLMIFLVLVVCGSSTSAVPRCCLAPRLWGPVIDSSIVLIRGNLARYARSARHVRKDEVAILGLDLTHVLQQSTLGFCLLSPRQTRFKHSPTATT